MKKNKKQFKHEGFTIEELADEWLKKFILSLDGNDNHDIEVKNIWFNEPYTDIDNIVEDKTAQTIYWCSCKRIFRRQNLLKYFLHFINFFNHRGFQEHFWYNYCHVLVFISPEIDDKYKDETMIKLNNHMDIVQTIIENYNQNKEGISSEEKNQHTYDPFMIQQEMEYKSNSDLIEKLEILIEKLNKEEQSDPQLISDGVSVIAELKQTKNIDDYKPTTLLKDLIFFMKRLYKMNDEIDMKKDPGKLIASYIKRRLKNYRRKHKENKSSGCEFRFLVEPEYLPEIDKNFLCVDFKNLLKCNL